MVANISTWGVEIEAGWRPICGYNMGGYNMDNTSCPRTSSCYHSKVESIEELGWKMVGDGSISCNRNGIALEANSIVYDDLETLKRDIFIAYEDVVEVNQSMGFHVHIGVPKSVYYDLSSWSYVKYFISKFKAKFPQYSSRLRRSYCVNYSGLTDFIKTHERQVSAYGKDGCRYRAINYCYNLHGTIEYRLFPMVDEPEIVMEFLDLVKDTVDVRVKNSSRVMRRWVASSQEDFTESVVEIAPEPWKDIPIPPSISQHWNIGIPGQSPPIQSGQPRQRCLYCDENWCDDCSAYHHTDDCVILGER